MHHHRHKNSFAIQPKRDEQDVADRLRSLSLQIVDGGLAGVIFIVPFIMGGRHAIGQMILVALTVVIVLAWALRQSLRDNATWRLTWALALIFAGAMLLLLQAMSLPQMLLERLTPQHADLLPLWNVQLMGFTTLGCWPFISFTPRDTIAGLVLFLTYSLLFFVTLQRLREIKHVERILRWCAISVICMALFAMLQYFLNNGKYFWFYSCPFADTAHELKGSFSNRNHFAHFLALGVGPLIWWLHNAYRRRPARTGNLPLSTTEGATGEESKIYILGLALAIVVFAGLLSLSRGGMGALVLATTVSATACWMSLASARRFLGVLIAAGALIGAALYVFGLDQVGRRLETINFRVDAQRDWTAGRTTIWAAAIKAIPQHLAFGAGVGSFREVYPIYADGALDNKIVFTHAENSYLQILLETGVIGGGLVFAGIGLLCYWSLKGWKGPQRLKVCAGAIAASLCASLAHALVDFVWYVPACMAIISILAACALRVKQFADDPSGANSASPLPRWAALALTLIFIPLGAGMIYNRIGPAVAAPYWDQYLLTQGEPSEVQAATEKVGQKSALNAIADAVVREQKIIDCLENVIYWDPTHARAHLALGEAHLRLFEKIQTTSQNPMTLVNIRDAALASRFSSREELCAWLSRALGEHWVHLDAALQHTRRALWFCPLQGRGYISLAKLCFLDSAPISKQTYLEQALRVRPFDGPVVYSAAAEYFLAGDMPRWLELSRHLFNCGRKFQQKLLNDLVDYTPPENIQGMIDFILAQFHLDLANLQVLHQACAKRCAAEQLVSLCRYEAQTAETEANKLKNSEAAGCWLKAQELYARLGDGAQALACARSAVHSDQNNYWAHYALAMRLLEQKQFAEAESQLHWCLQRQPQDKYLESKLKDALQGRLDAERAAALRGNHF